MDTQRKTPAFSMVDRIDCGGNLRIDEFCQWAAISRSSAYQEVAAGRLKILKVGRRSVIPVHAAKAWLAVVER